MSSSFREAVQYLSSSSNANPSTAVKLELYGIFKFVTVAPQPNTTRPSIIDMTGRAKWDAWKSASTMYSSKEQAEAKYIAIAQNLGWKKGESANTAAKPKPADGDDIWDDDETSRNTKTGGFGITVSSMSAPKEENDGGLHFAVVDNDMQRIITLLDMAHDINARDEYGYTPLHLGADRGNLTAVQELVRRGADHSLKDPDDLTARELASIAGHVDIVAAIPPP